MKSQGKVELFNISVDLSNIINDLYDISNGLRSNFCGIGTDICSNKVEDIAGQCSYVRERINNIDTRKFTEKYLNEHPELSEN